MACGVTLLLTVLLCIGAVMVTSNPRTNSDPTLATNNQDQLLLDMQKEVTSLRQKNAVLMKQLTKLASRVDQLADEKKNATYVVWGNNECNGQGSYKIYSGYAAGPPYGSAAGSSVCLPDTPTWLHHVDGYSAEGAVIGPIQYNIDSGFSVQAFGEDLNHNTMLCTVCHSPRPDVLMIPGASTCSQGWTEEYKGYLMGDATTGSPGAGYICVDSQSLTIPYNSSYPIYAMGAYLVEVRCGFLPCDDYPDGREMACVVCSR